MSLMPKKGRVASTYEMAKLSARITPQIKKIVNKMDEDFVRSALISDIKMTELAKNLYEELTPDIRNKIHIDYFVSLILANKSTVMKKNKNKKKVR